MYHGTPATAAASILGSDFRPSTGGTLGQGIYFSKDVQKTAAYAGRDSNGGVVFKVLVFAGRTKKISPPDFALQTTWHSKYDTAWLPPVGRMEENCVKCKEQIKIIGVVKGFHLLPASAQNRTRQVAPGDRLTPAEKKDLDAMVADFKHILNVTRN